MAGVHWELFSNAYIGTIALAICAAYLGVYIVLKRIIFFGIGLIQIASLGVAIAFLLGQSAIFWSVIITFIGIILFVNVQNKVLVTNENIIGIVYTSAGAFSLLLIKKSALGTDELQNFFYGHLLLVSETHVAIMLCVFSIVLLLHIIFFRQFLFVAFDAQMAKTLGMKTKVWDIFFFFTLGIVVAISTKTAGSLLMFSYLIIPSTTAIITAKRVKMTFAFAVFYAVLASVIGLYLQHLWGFPPAQTIISVETFILMLVVIWRKQKLLAIAFLLLCIYSASLIPAYDRKTEEQFNESILLVKEETNRRPDVAIYNDNGYIKDNEQTKIVLTIENLGEEYILFYLCLDLGIEVIDMKIELKAKEKSTKEILIASEIIELLPEKVTVLLSFWDDEYLIVPSSYRIESNAIILRKN